MFPYDIDAPWWKDVVYDFKFTEKVPQPFKVGIEYETYVTNMQVYLPWLHSWFHDLGGKTLKKEIKSLEEACMITETNVIIDCSGLGAIKIKGIEDKKMFPVRGQSIVVRAPFVERLLGNPGIGATPLPAYIIPLKKDGLVLLGSTLQKNDWLRVPREEDAKAIFERCAEIVPQLKELKEEDILEHKVGLRPEREGGPCISYQLLAGVGESKMEVHLIRANGFGGYGVQSSWGAAKEVIKMMNGHLFKNKSKL